MRSCRTTTRYKQCILDNFYLDAQYQVRRKRDGYFGRFKQGDPVNFFSSTGGYLKCTIPVEGTGLPKTTTTRASIVYLLVHGELSDTDDIDHIDGNRQNDHPDNLRAVNRQLNSRNRAKRCDNTSGITGIRWEASKGRYVIRKTVGNKRKVTSRVTLEEALEVLAEFTAMAGNYTDRHGT